MTLLERAAAGLTPSLVPLTVHQYHQMIDAGILGDGAPVELIDGLLVMKDHSVLPDLVRLTVDQYHQMIDTGILEEGAPVEL